MRWLWVIPITAFAGLFFGFDWLTGPTGGDRNAESGRTFFMILIGAGLLVCFRQFLYSFKR